MTPLRRGLAGLAAVYLALAVFGHLSDYVGLPSYVLVLAATVLFWMTQATSWTILSGYAGYFSFGQGAYVAVGAYTTAVLNGRNGVGFFWTVPLGALAGAVLALGVGAVAFRLRSLRGEIFALLTLAVPFILAAFARINNDIDGGQGTTVPLPDYPEWIGAFPHLLFELNLLVAAIALGVSLAIHRSRLGHGLAAVHDAEDAAEVLGVPTFRYKMIAIVLGGAIGGLGGTMFVLQLGFVAVESVLNLTIPLFVIVMSVLGGRGHWLGPVIGSTMVVLLQDRLAAEGLADWSAIIFGTVLAVLVVAAGDGLHAYLRARPLHALAAFAVALALCLALGTVDPIAAVLIAMIAAAVTAITATRLSRHRRRTPPSAPAEPPAADDLKGTVPAPPAEPADAVPAPPREPRDSVPVAARGTPSSPGGEVPLIECDRVTRYFGGVRALEKVSFSIGEGEIVGLVGPNGSGKTTLVNLLSGALRPTSGTIRIAGRPTTGLPAHRIAHAGIARTYQIPKPFESMTVRDNVAMAVMFGRDHAALPAAREAAGRHLATVRLAHLADAHPHELNLHQRQLLEMARAIAADPVVLLLDEALAGLNPAEIDDAVAVIRRIHETGISIIIVEHLLRVLRGLATRLVVLDRGVHIADGDPSTVLADPAVVEAYVGRQRA